MKDLDTSARGRTDAAGAEHSSDDELLQMQQEVLEELEEHQGPPGKPLYNFIAVGLVLVVCAYVIVAARGYGLGTTADPGAGMWPFILGIFTAVMAVFIGLRAKKVNDTSQFHKGSLQAACGLVVMLSFGILLPFVGFEIPAFIVCFVWLKVLGKESWRLSIIASVLIVAAFYAVFVLALHAPVPRLI